MIHWTPKSNVSRRHQVHLSPGFYGPDRGDSCEDEKERVKIGKKRWRVGTFILPQSTQHMLLLIVNFFIIFFLLLTCGLFHSITILCSHSHCLCPCPHCLDLHGLGGLLVFNLLFTDFGVSNILHWPLCLTCNPWKKAKDNTIVVSSFHQLSSTLTWWLWMY